MWGRKNIHEFSGFRVPHKSFSMKFGCAAPWHLWYVLAFHESFLHKMVTFYQPVKVFFLENFLLHGTIIVLLPSQYFDNCHFCPFIKRGGACFWENMACSCAVHVVEGSFRLPPACINDCVFRYHRIWCGCLSTCTSCKKNICLDVLKYWLTTAVTIHHSRFWDQLVCDKQLLTAQYPLHMCIN